MLNEQGFEMLKEIPKRTLSSSDLMSVTSALQTLLGSIASQMRAEHPGVALKLSETEARLIGTVKLYEATTGVVVKHMLEQA